MIPQPPAELIAKRLKQARLAHHITLDQAASALRIRLHYVEAMESGDFDAFPSPAQARGFLRSYAQSLGLDSEAFMAAFDGDNSLLEAGPASAAPDEQPEPGDQAGQSMYGEPSQPETSPGGLPASQPGSSPRAPASSRRAASRSALAPFMEVGQKLRTQRETLGLSLDDVERHTRLRAFYLKALEAGDLDGLPSPVQGRGMLKNYASFLGMDTDALLLKFAEGLQARLSERQGSRRLRLGSRSAEMTPLGSPRPRLITTDLLLAGVLVVFLVAFVAWGAIRISGMQGRQSPTPTAPGISDVLAQVGTPTNPYAAQVTLEGETPGTPTAELPLALSTPTAAPDVPTPPPNFSSAAVQVIVSVRMSAWMRVTVDDKLAFEGRVLPGSAFPFAGDQRIEILTGNGAGLDVNFNQSDIGVLGAFGQAVQRVFTVQGVQTPTPSITPTPEPDTATPTFTPTP